MRYKFTLTVTVHPLSVAELRDEALKAVEKAMKFFPTLHIGVEPMSKNRVDLKECPRCDTTTHHKPAKPREGRALKNDFRAKKARKQATVH